MSATQSHAATYTWDAGGETDTNWTTAANWTTDTVATSNAASNVIISSSAAVTTTSTVDTNNPWSLNTLVFNATTLGNVALSGNKLSFVVDGNNSYTVLDVGGLATGLSVTINNDIFVNNTSTGNNAEVRFNLSSSAAILNLYGKITTTGSNVLTFAANGGVANIYGNFDLGSTGTFRKRDNTTLNIYSTGNKYGTLILGGGGAINLYAANALDSTGLIYDGGSTLKLNGFDQTIAGFAATTYKGNISSTTAASFTVNASVNSVYAGVLSGALALKKTGSATLELDGANTYTGATTVNGGTLIVNGSIAAGSAVTVANGATLSGTGIVNGSTAIQGTLAAGSGGVGTLKTGALTLASTAVLDVELGRNDAIATSDLTSVTGSVNIGDGANLKLTLGAGLSDLVEGDIVFLIANDSTDAVQGAFSSLNGVTTTLSEGSTFAWNSQTWEITYKADFGTSSFSGGNDVALMVVPEPSTWAMLMGGIGMLAFGQRLRSRRS